MHLTVVLAALEELVLVVTGDLGGLVLLRCLMFGSDAHTCTYVFVW